MTSSKMATKYTSNYKPTDEKEKSFKVGDLVSALPVKGGEIRGMIVQVNSNSCELVILDTSDYIKDSFYKVGAVVTWIYEDVTLLNGTLTLTQEIV